MLGLLAFLVVAMFVIVAPLTWFLLTMNPEKGVSKVVPLIETGTTVEAEMKAERLRLGGVRAYVRTMGAGERRAIDAWNPVDMARISRTVWGENTR